ncbi:MAG: T9SS type A sorting domain-containing protein [Flavobacteriales bacterium]|nr:T9SS type A sorting domain-containing protein [Flavobacteriia bacterium]NCP06532.1 T9SS type A sorting domain-containing protein [Flavobacteriales bacterium]PIV93723.1 MAG: secretion protein [Flavobacteriaceae bacterium CG17_big_fil_post_rev_8_21_14_2_50_33_15]PIY12763.1 MAG: secretion protein [Flavobacteriaceae bacterium CG_4_10_14_3_um_filter_33_47]PJB18582.1 MAG: secretion protein [Flavobacteriaceae bacterium CG_4_9_14_3_um_filter_33_16]
MKIIISIFVFVLGTFSCIGQISAAVEKFALPSSLSESSGAIFFNNKIITHNDSGGENKLYELDTITGVVTRTVTITNATNVDWEDITHDNMNIYLGDFGNNNGNRTDLKIYKVDKNDYINNTSVTAETIAFSYTDQTDFTANTNTEWDGEALVSFDATNLILFTKNWVNGITKAYLVPKAQGTYSLTPLATSLNSGGLITGGTFNPLTNKLFLVGYTYTIPTNVLQPFVWVSENFNGNDIFSGTNTQTFMPSFALEQAEAITYVSENRYFITSESFNQSGFSDYAKLIAFSTNDVTLSAENNMPENHTMLYPNPVNNMLYLENGLINTVEIYDNKLTKLYTGNSKSIDMSAFSVGIYMVIIHTNNNLPIIKKIVKK